MTEEKRMGFLRRAGWTGLAALACVASLCAQVLIGVAVSVLASVLAAVRARSMGVTGLEEITEITMQAAMDMAPLSILIYHIIAVAGFGLWYYFGCGRPKQGKLKDVLRPRTIGTAVLCGFGMNLSANAFVMLAPYFAPDAMRVYENLMEAAGLGDNALAIIASVLIAPVGEEILCRGLTFHYAQRATAGMKNGALAFWIANVIQALLFGIMHFNLIQGSYAFVLGLGLGLLRKRYNSLYPAILAHFTVNFLSTFVMDKLLGPLPEGLPYYCLVGIAGFAVLAGAYFLGREKRAPQKEC